MRLTEKQAMIMFDVLKAALRIQGGFAGYKTEDLSKIANQIINQQSDEIVELERDIIKGGQNEAVKDIEK